MNTQTSNYRGSARTAEHVRAEIANRWGEDAACAYDPYHNCFTLHEWRKRNYRVRKGEKSIRMTTFIETHDARGNVHSYPKTVHLFYHLQVEAENNS